MKYLLFCCFLINTCYLFSQKDSITAFDKNGKPKEYAVFRNGIYLQKKISHKINTIWNREPNLTQYDTTLQYEFVYPKNYKRPVGRVDTLFISQKKNQPDVISAIFQKDSITEIFSSNIGKNFSIIKRFSNGWKYVENHTETLITQSYYYQDTYDSICSEYDKKTKEKTVFQFFGQGAKKWSLSRYKNDTLLTITKIDDNIPFWSFVEYYANGQKKREIIAFKDSIPTLHTWAENGKKHRIEKTWLYNMFGKKIIEDDKPFLLKVFPYYSGFYVKFFSLQKKKKVEYDDWGFEGEGMAEDDGKEWGFAEDFEEETVKKDSVSTSKKVRQKKKKGYQYAAPLFKIYRFRQGMYMENPLYIDRKGRFICEYTSEKDFGNGVKPYSYGYFFMKEKRKEKQTVPYIPLEEDEYQIGYNYDYRGNRLLNQYICFINHERHDFFWSFEERYNMRARVGVGQNIEMPVRGMYSSCGEYNPILMANHQIDAVGIGCTGEVILNSWFYLLANMDIQKERENAKIPQKDICYTVLNIDGLYDCYVKNQKQFLKQKWAALYQSDSTLPENINQFVRLYYRENVLKKVVFMNSVLDESGVIILKLEKDKKAKTKAQKEVERLLFQMPSYIIPQTNGRKRKIVFDYHIY